MSKSFILPITDGTTTYNTASRQANRHYVTFGVTGAAITGTATISARFPGGSVFEAIPDGTDISLAAPETVGFDGHISQLQVVLDSVSGVTELTMTINNRGQ